MQKIVIAALLCVSLLVIGCTDKKVESAAKPAAKSAEMKVHGGGETKDSAPSGFSDVVKKQTLPTYPAMTVGAAFDGYTHLTKKEWKEIRAANGTIYIDFSGWLQGNSLSIDAISKGVAQQGIEVKFIIKPDGTFYVGMASKLEATTDGKVRGYPLTDVKIIMDRIYANKEISF